MKTFTAIIAVSLFSLAAAQVTCSPGYYDAGAPGCKKCPLGTYQPDEGRTECKPCPDGFASMDEGRSECVPCGLNQEPTRFKDSCQCAPGAAQDRQGNCMICKPGTHMFTFRRGKAPVCRSCDPYQFQPKAGQTSCIPCPDGQVASNDRTFCFKCPGDQVPNEDRTGCCAEGEQLLKFDGRTSCGTCPPGQFQILTSDLDLVCMECEPGTFKATAGLEECVQCPRNSFSMRGGTKCVTCPEGKAPINKNGRCGTCPPRSFFNQSVFRCTKCEEGTFQPDENIRQSCLSCSSDTNTVKGATMCTKCALGEGLMKDGTCGVCPPGTEYFRDTRRCSKCTINYYRAANDTNLECSRCARFSYALPGASECTIRCPAGQALIVKGNKGKCKACRRGFVYQAYSGQCVDCRRYEGANSVSPGGNTEECIQCWDNTLPNADRTACDKIVKLP